VNGLDNDLAGVDSIANLGGLCDFCDRPATYRTELGLMCGPCHGYLVIARKLASKLAE
jgi:hypothetical protein